MLKHYLNDYINQFPESDSLLPMVYSLGEDQVLEILKKREGREIVFAEYQLGDPLDGLKWNYN